jgi:hypothetical protein
MMSPMAGKRIVGAIAAGLVVAVMSSCSWRLETEPDAFRTPSEVTILRDHAAAAEQAVAAAANASQGALAEAEVRNAPVRIDALGGVSPTSSPRPAADLDAALAAAIEAAHVCEDGAGDDPIGALCAAIELSHHLGLFAADPEPRAPEARAVDPSAGFVPAGETSVGSDELAQLALEHDRARALYETVAARASGDERTTALNRGRLHRERVAQLLELPGVDNLTQPSYAVPAASVVDTVARASAVQQTERSLGDGYSALMVSAEAADRAWLMNAAYDAYAAASPTPADVPALPGVAP